MRFRQLVRISKSGIRCRRVERNPLNPPSASSGFSSPDLSALHALGRSTSSARPP